MQDQGPETPKVPRGLRRAVYLTQHVWNAVKAFFKVRHGLRRAVYFTLGLYSLALAVLGAILPVLPCTPFVLLASFFFVRSSPALNDRLLRSRLFGPMLRDWQERGGLRPHVKLTAVGMILAAVGASAYFADLEWPLLALLIVLGLVGLTVVLRLPVVRDGPTQDKAAALETVPPAPAPSQLPCRGADDGQELVRRQAGPAD